MTAADSTLCNALPSTTRTQTLSNQLPGKPKYQTIWYHSAMNGHRFGRSPVLAEEAEADDPEDSL
jgi:hypothetical protein